MYSVSLVGGRRKGGLCSTATASEEEHKQAYVPPHDYSTDMTDSQPEISRACWWGGGNSEY